MIFTFYNYFLVSLALNTLLLTNIKRDGSGIAFPTS